MHTSAYYLLQNSNFLNCIQRFVRSNECSNPTKFVWALMYAHESKVLVLLALGLVITAFCSYTCIAEY